ncbi:hypothetical protein BBBOND_0107820 [Babesia bigemina]|uniref:Uncharacterized protein n=1 Tax=Babesia bigemina TaxID=5866 RepID=A0A061D6C5_BABBI|nr:hypothetical protein BBBOND_0107820 [Babesia bigemina]CDR94484.1 hypothetical protein BBBOND_0107820 [Babesia bigemina]|eukprot:XP_012766670.1 hypothetical protein BBBOND_0107820 [Babesia bigemina]
MLVIVIVVSQFATQILLQIAVRDGFTVDAYEELDGFAKGYGALYQKVILLRDVNDLYSHIAEKLKTNL